MQESSTILKVQNYNSSESTVYNTSYNILTNTLFPVLFFCHNIYQGMGVAGSPLFDATSSFEFGNNCQQRDLPLFRVLQWQKCGSFFLLWGV